MTRTQASQFYIRLMEESRHLGMSDYFVSVTATMAKPEVAGSYIDLLEAADVDLSAKTAVDLGCKFGHALPLLLQFGAKQAIGVDAQERYLAEGQRVFGRLYSQIEFQLCEEGYLELESDSVDFVFANEVISHVNPAYLPVLYGEIARVLKPGGVLLISDGNNWANRECRADLLQVYDAWENGPAGRSTGRDVVTQPYCELRLALIAQLRPDLDAKTQRYLAATTFGLFGKRLEKVVMAYRPGEKFVERRYRPGIAPTNPEAGGFVMERAFHPRQVELELETLGLEARQLLWRARSAREFVSTVRRRLGDPRLFFSREARRAENWGFVIRARKRI